MCGRPDDSGAWLGQPGEQESPLRSIDPVLRDSTETAEHKDKVFRQVGRVVRTRNSSNTGVLSATDAKGDTSIAEYKGTGATDWINNIIAFE